MKLKSIFLKSISKKNITFKSAEIIIKSDLNTILFYSNLIRTEFKKNKIRLCSIINAKSGYCSEDCTFCAQSSHYNVDIKKYSFVNTKNILNRALDAYKNSINEFSIVISGKTPSKSDMIKIANAVSELKKMGIQPCASCGMLTKNELLYLKTAGLDNYHHNLETSENHFKNICSTHSYMEDIAAVKNAKSAGLRVCCGGIFGVGETWKDRYDLASTLKKLNVDSIPINFLHPIKGTPLYGNTLLNPSEALRIIALFRFMLPDKDIVVCGGRLKVLKEFHPMIYWAGANAVLTGDYLVTKGMSVKKDLKILNQLGLELYSAKP